MSSKAKLMELIEELPEDKIPQAVLFLQNLINKGQEVTAASEVADPLNTFMAHVVYSLTNAMYDLSIDAKRKEEKVMANRLESYRKRVADGWDVYRKNK